MYGDDALTLEGYKRLNGDPPSPIDPPPPPGPVEPAVPPVAPMRACSECGKPIAPGQDIRIPKLKR